MTRDGRSARSGAGWFTTVHVQVGRSRATGGEMTLSSLSLQVLLGLGEEAGLGHGWRRIAGRGLGAEG